MHAPARTASRMLRSFGLALIVVLVCSASVIPLVASAPAPIERSRRSAAYPCNTGTTSGMTFTYDDVHRWNDPIIAISNLTGVPANVIKGIMWVESRGMLNARSPLTSSGYYFGLMQIGATSAVPEYMKSVTWMCNNAYNQTLAGATELVNKSHAIGSTDWIEVAGAYFGYGTDVTGTTTNAYMQMFANHATAMIGTSPGAIDWTPPAPPTPTPIPWLSYPSGTTLTVDTARLNMRATPGTSGTIIRVLTRGQQAIVLDGPQKIDSMYWYRIQLPDGTIGWIAGNYTTGPQSTPTATATPSITPTPSDTPTPSVTPTLGSTTPTETATATATSNAGALYRTTARLNLRATPSTSGTILATLASGTIVTLLGESQEASGYLWQRVQAGSRTGWVAMTYLRPSISPTPLPTRTPSPTATAGSVDLGPSFSIGDTVAVRSGPLNYRAAPGTSAPIYGTLVSGTRGVVLDGPSLVGELAWYQLRIAGKPEGWVAGRYLLLVTPANTPSPLPTETLQLTTEPTMTATEIQPSVTPTETPLVEEPPTSEPPTETPVIEPSPTETPPDTDLDGIEDALDSCPETANFGTDIDEDGIDDACDPVAPPEVALESLE